MRTNVSRRVARRGEEGTILILTLIAAVFVAGLAYALFFVGHGEIEGTKAEARREKAFQAAEAGVEEALNRLNNGAGADVDRSHDGANPYRVETTDIAATSSGNRLITFTSSSAVASEARRVEAVVENQSLALRVRGAITSNGPVSLSGSIIVDGRDYDANGSGVVGNGVNGIVSSLTVLSGGSASVGGNGVPPINRPGPLSGVYQELVPYGDGIDSDHDGHVDEEAYDGIDNDHDGRVDEDLVPFAATPDSMFGVPEGTINRLAQSNGTYFTNQSDFDAYLARNGGEVPGGRVIVLDFPSTPLAGPVWNPADFGDEYNDEPSIVVFHSQHSNAVVKNLHGKFKGLLLTDYVDHVDGNARVLGAICSFGHQMIGNLFGNGNARIYYSSAVLNMLPTIPFFSIRAWREVTAGE